MTTTIHKTEYTYDTLELPRFGFRIPVAIDGAKMWLPVRPICEDLGVDSHTQLTFLRGSPKFSGSLDKVPFATKDGGHWRTYTCLPRTKIPRWIDDIEPWRATNVQTRARLEELQRDFTEALDRLFFKYAPKADGDDRGVISHTSRSVTVFTCFDCGATYQIVSENGQTYVVRQDGDSKA